MWVEGPLKISIIAEGWPSLNIWNMKYKTISTKFPVHIKQVSIIHSKNKVIKS